MKFLWSLFFIFISHISFANDSLLIQKTLQSIVNKQQIQTNFFVEGSFTSLRQYSNSENLQLDNNIFFTALIAFTLKDLKPFLTKDENIVVDTIIERTKKAFTFYKNKKRLSYNFWRTDVDDNFFPNDDVLPLFKKQLKLPDDLDDTSIILAAILSNDSTAKAIHKTMQEFINCKSNRIKNTLKKYNKIEAYSTWYGVKMPVDFDFGVHCNILSFVNKFNLNFSKTDSATLNLLVDMIDEKCHLKKADYISPYYSLPSVLLYHIARLMSTKKIEELEKRKPIIINQIKDELKNETNVLHKTLLVSSLYKLGVYDVEVDFKKATKEEINSTNFVYYTGHIFGHLNNTIKKIASKLDATQYKWYCSAFNDCLILENLILKNRVRY